MSEFRFSLAFEWKNEPVRVVLLAGSLRAIGVWLDERYPGVALVRIERLADV